MGRCPDDNGRISLSIVTEYVSGLWRDWPLRGANITGVNFSIFLVAGHRVIAPLGLTHYQAVAGIYGKIGSQWRINHFGNSVVNDRYLIGVYTARSKISTEQITDGTSKMLAFGEAPGSIGQGIEPYPGCAGEFPVGYRLDWHSRAGNELWPGRVARERSPQSRRFVPNASILLRQCAPGRHGAVRACGWIGTRSPEKCRFGRLSRAVNNRRRRDR